MFFIGLGTASPEQRYSQNACLEALQDSPQFGQLSRRSRSLLNRILSHPHGIEHRHLALTDLSRAFTLTPDALQHRFAESAPRLASKAAMTALLASGKTAAEIDAVIISTCTGYLCPGLTSYVTEALGLRPDVLALDLVGQGCGAAVPNFRSADALIHSHRARYVLSICVEICSAAVYLDDDPGVLVSTCLFADGAGAAVLSGSKGKAGHHIEWIGSDCITDPRLRDRLRFVHQNGMLKNVLSPDVPQLAARYAKQVLDKLLTYHGLAQSEIRGWILHGGGKSVLDNLQAGMTLSDDAVAPSRSVLRDYGNVSSAFVYFVMAYVLVRDPERGWWWLSSFGAGFSCHGALLLIS